MQTISYPDSRTSSSPRCELVGRDRELRRLVGLLVDPSEHGPAVVLHGEPGIGKTRLLDEAAARASDQGMLVVRTAGHKGEVDMPFAGIHRLISRLSAHTDDLPGAHRRSLDRLADPARQGADPFSVVVAVLSLLVRVASGSRLLVTVDDAQWLDHLSSRVLACVARRLEPGQAVLMCALRDGFESELRESGIAPLQIGGLDEPASAEVLDRHAPDLTLALRGRVLADGGGNPLALIELPVAWSGLPCWQVETPCTSRLREAFGDRLCELSPLPRQALLVCALAERISLAEVLEATTILAGSRPTLHDLAAAEAVRLVEIHEDGIRFRHRLTAPAVVSAHSVPERHAAHEALALALAAQPARALRHAAAALVKANEPLAAQLEGVALDALRHGVTADAVVTLRRAAQVSGERQRGRRLLAAAELASELGSRDEVAQLVEGLDPRELSASERARLYWLREFLLDAAGESSVRTMVDCATGLIDAREARGALNALLSAALKCFWTDADAPARELVLQAADRLPVPPENAWRVAINAFAATEERGNAVLDLIASANPAEPKLESGDESRLSEELRLYALALSVIPDNVRAREVQACAIARLRQQGRDALLSRALASQACIAMALGDWPLATQAGAEGMRLAQDTRQPRYEAACRLALAGAAGVAGDTAASEQMLVEAERALAPLRPCWPFPLIEITKATLALSMGAHATAFDRCRRGFDRSDPSYHWITSHSARVLMDLADAGLASGNAEAASEIIATLSGPENSVEFGWGIAYAKAVLASPSVDSDEAFASLASLAPPSEFAHARRHLAWGMRLRRQRRAADSRRHLRIAQDGFDAVAAAPWSERAQEELRASGETSRRRSPESVDELSPQEIQIARLAAKGFTNREIGAQLFVSHRTVGAHLYRIFPKLSITSRAQLRDAMSGLAVRS